MLTPVLPDGTLSARPYVGRFAPSPTGALHAGSLVAAMASYLDARARRGRWLVRIEDVDQTRTIVGAADSMLAMLAAFGMQSDGAVIWQSQRSDRYAAAFEQLQQRAYPCGCSRREIADSNGGEIGGGFGGNRPAQGGLDAEAAIYPGTCRAGLVAGRAARAWRIRVPETGAPEDCIRYHDRVCGWQTQTLSRQAGDFVIRRADGFWAYQLAVVVDDAAQDITHVVRGMDLLESTPRQIYLQRLLGVSTPAYLHLPLVRNDLDEKLSKQTGATALDATSPLPHLLAAAKTLGLGMVTTTSVDGFWLQAVDQWERSVETGLAAMQNREKSAFGHATQ